MENQNFSVCGLDCHVCDSFENSCKECSFFKECELPKRHALTGTPKCPIYNCIKSKGYESCGECEALPCKLWSEFKIPGWTDEQHRQSIIDRVELLHKIYEKA